MEILIFSKTFGERAILVDEADYALLQNHTWHNHKNQYPRTYIRIEGTSKYKCLTVHSLLTNGVGIVDHIDGNGFNNQRSNLRICSKAQNCRNRRTPITNSTGFKGVSIDKKIRGEKKFFAQIGLNKKTLFLGRFEKATDAALAYNQAAIKYFGEFAHLNEIST